MRILIIHHRENIPGTLRPDLLGRELGKRGNKVTIIGTSEKRKFKIAKKITDDVETIEMPDLFWNGLRRGFDPWNTFRRVLFLINKEFDIVHAFDSRPNVILPALFLKYTKGIPLVLDWADWWGRNGTISKRSGRLFRYTLGWLEVFFEEKFRKFADGSTVVSTALRERLQGLGYTKKILISHHGCDVERIKPIEKSTARKKLGFDESSYILGYLGNIFCTDAELLFEAVGMISKKYKLTLLLIGRNINPLRQKVPTFVKNTGSVDYRTILNYVASCDVCLLPLKRDVANNGRWPSKMNDYLQLGKPIVSTPVGDLQRIFSEKHIGLLADDTPQEFAKGIFRVLENRALADELGRNGRRYAEEELDWRILAHRLNNFYTEIRNEKNDRSSQKASGSNQNKLI